jgi:nucleotide-binding universal stress UspA family protein
MNEMKTILVTTDFSETSQKAFSVARGLAEKYGAEVVVAYVEEDRPPTMILEHADVGLEEIMQRQGKLAVARLRDLVDGPFGDVPVETRVSSGIPHVQIVQLAEEVNADLIVMATHGRGFISHAILGSTTERVVRRAPCPVLVVRDPHPE